MRFPRPDGVSMTNGLIVLGYENNDDRDLAYDWLEAFGSGVVSAPNGDERTCAKCHAVLADGPQPSTTYSEEDDDYYKPDSSGYSRADEEWFFDMDGKP